MTEDNGKKLTLSGKSTLTLKRTNTSLSSEGRKVVQVEVRKKRFVQQQTPAKSAVEIDEALAQKLELLAKAKEHEDQKKTGRRRKRTFAQKQREEAEALRKQQEEEKAKAEAEKVEAEKKLPNRKRRRRQHLSFLKTMPNLIINIKIKKMIMTKKMTTIMPKKAKKHRS